MSATINLEPGYLSPALTEIPPFPTVAIKALQIISNERSQLRELSELITTDAAISGHLLYMANSALFGGRLEVSSILQAVHLLGLERIKGAVITIAMRSYLSDSLEVPALRACWRHSVACAIISEIFAKLTLMEPEVAYTVGLMHDVGRLAMVAGYPTKYGNFLMMMEGKRYDSLQCERDAFGIDHCQAGRLLVERWKLPKMFVAVTSKHHEPPSPGDPAALSTVRQSCRMADALGFNIVCSGPRSAYEEILSELPEHGRGRFPVDPAELTSVIATKINLIECV